MRHPNSFYIGDKAIVQLGDPRPHEVEILGFVKAGSSQMVRIEYPDGTRRRCRFEALTTLATSSNPGNPQLSDSC